MADELILYVKKYFREGKQCNLGYGVEVITESGRNITKFDNFDLNSLAGTFRGRSGRIFKNLKDSESEVQMPKNGCVVLKTGLSLEELTTFAELLSNDFN